jgi:lysozyme
MNKIRYAVSSLAVVGVLVAGIKGHEGKENTAYVDRLAYNKAVTVCYGHTRTAVLGQRYTDAQCDVLLLKDLNEIYAPIVRKLVKVPLSQGEFNALVDFTYNLGEGNFRSSTLLRLVNAGRYEEAGNEFSKWKFTNGKDCTIRANKCFGIIERREWEAQQFAS